MIKERTIKFLTLVVGAVTAVLSYIKRPKYSDEESDWETKIYDCGEAACYGSIAVLAVSVVLNFLACADIHTESESIRKIELMIYLAVVILLSVLGGLFTKITWDYSEYFAYRLHIRNLTSLSFLCNAFTFLLLFVVVYKQQTDARTIRK